MTRNKKKVQKLFILVVQWPDGKVNQVITNYDYESLVVEAMDLAKEICGFWTILDAAGKHVDGNFNAALVRPKETHK